MVIHKIEGGSSKKYIYLGNYPEGQERECGGLWTLEKKKWSVVREPALSTMFCLMSVRMWQKENIEGEFEKQEANLTCPLPEIFWQ